MVTPVKFRVRTDNFDAATDEQANEEKVEEMRQSYP
jgi:hypothetical protein